MFRRQPLNTAGWLVQESALLHAVCVEEPQNLKMAIDKRI